MSERKDFERACDTYYDAVKRGYDYYEPRKAMRALFSRAIETRDTEIAALREQLREANRRAFDAETQMEEEAAAHCAQLARVTEILDALREAAKERDYQQSIDLHDAPENSNRSRCREYQAIQRALDLTLDFDAARVSGAE